ncbi:related to Lipase 2 precursor [Ustilago sp. UG-2017a]|nr:related to Lipase 2 precursor [Ustilago sp. UG-2017a]
MLCLPNCFLSALPHNPGKQPIVRIQQGTVTGLTGSKYGIDHFFGIPFAKPPTGDLRFAKPVAVEPSPKSDTDATRFGDICMQPSRAEPTLYKKSVEIGKPIVFVAMNYRTGPFSFIGGSEVAASDSATTNAGLYNQRSALQSVQNNIPSFVGDPNKVTLFEESAGAMSMALQTIAYDGQTQGLYHAAIMVSGASAPGPLLTPKRPTVEKTSKDLAARQAATVLTGIDPIAGALAFLPLVDYKLITNYPSVQLPQGKLADIPVIQGNNLDEVFENYPDDPSEASPYYNAETATSAGTTQNLGSRIYEPFASNQYKRSSSFYGDFTFNAHRRAYLQGTQLRGRRNKDKTWSFQFSQNDKSPVSCIATIEARWLGESSLPRTMLVFEVFLLSMMVVLLLNDDDDLNKGYPAKLGIYPIVLKLTHRVCTVEVDKAAQSVETAEVVFTAE